VPTGQKENCQGQPKESMGTPGNFIKFIHVKLPEQQVDYHTQTYHNRKDYPGEPNGLQRILLLLI
jgi:hypothetical protein